MRWGVILLLVLWAVPVWAVVPPTENIEVAGLKVAVWLPKAMATPEECAEWPVIVFSHGFHGSATQSTYLMGALAQAGYAVFAPNHADAAQENEVIKWLRRPQENFRSDAKWSEVTYADRKADVVRLINALEMDPTYKNLNWSKLGLAGHSLGGYTALGLAGGWPSWKEERVKAVLAMTPYCIPYVERKTLGGVAVPVMIQEGTRDMLQPYVERKGGAYDQLAGVKYYVEMERAGHFNWADIRDTYHGVIAQYAVAFFDEALKGKPFPQELLEKHGKLVKRVKAGGRDTECAALGLLF